jgi:hypothetical protein
MTQSEIDDVRMPIGDRDVLVAREKKLAALAAGLFDRYGEETMAFAERQIEGTSGDTAKTWEAIVLYLRRLDRT